VRLGVAGGEGRKVADRVLLYSMVEPLGPAGSPR
jgi:hypothetical protein